ncbi:unnamed protein product [Paramecium primaurelia]|uniref:FCP1 homology domain-containing protein n=1 Tax=Paramecium primaurelia TaxID=5886 RepID=A0A8S1KJ33_PARPR|nr:unnamed protein product [Paramecium primaurelia]
MSFGKGKITFIQNKKLEEVVLETLKIQSKNNEEAKKLYMNDIQLELTSQQKVSSINQNNYSKLQNKVDQVQEKQNLQQNNKVYSSPALQKYQVNPKKAQESNVYRLKQKQYRRHQNENQKKKLRVLQKSRISRYFKSTYKIMSIFLFYQNKQTFYSKYQNLKMMYKTTQNCSYADLISRQGIQDNYRSIITIDKENSYALLQKKKQYQNRESSNSNQQKNENRSNSGLFKSASLQQFYRAQSAVEKNSYQNYKGNQQQINQMKNVSYLSLLQQSGYQLKHNYTKSTKELNNKWIDFLSNENQRQKSFENQAYKRLNEKLEYLEKKFNQLKDSFANVSESQQDKKTDRIKQKQYSMVTKYFPQKFIQQQKNVSQEESKVTKDIKSIFNIYSQMKDIKSYTSNSQLLKQSQDKNTGLLQDFVTQIKKNSNKNSQLLKGSQINETNQTFNKSERQQSMDSKYFYLNKISETQPNEPFLYYISTVIQAIKSKKPTELDELIKDHFSQTYQGLIYANRLVIQFDPNKVIYLPKSNHLKTIVFDLDETLIHCNSNLSIQGDIILPITFPNNETIQASINIRPYAKQILKTLSKDFEIIIFTASHSCYANMVIDYLDPKKQWISHRLFREHCIQTREGAYIKDLRILGNRKLCDVLLVDNASYSFNKQIDNGIPIISYYNNKEDQELLHLQNYLLNFRSVKDVRDLNQKQLKLKQFLDYSDFDDLQNNLKDIYF